MFKDRRDAGNQLAAKLEKFKDSNPLILAIPRGGMVTAYPVIKKYGFEWDLIIPRKIGLPNNKEVAIGAVTPDGSYLLNQNYLKLITIPSDYLEQEIAHQLKEINRRLKTYKGSPSLSSAKGKTVIVIDDGIATGFTILAAIKSIKKQGARKIIIAVPVAPADTIEKLAKEVDEVICLAVPDYFYAVGQQYQEFDQTTDQEVIRLVKDLSF